MCGYSHTRWRANTMSHQKRRGKLKIYLGYAAGVGKTYQMLEDAQRPQNARCGRRPRVSRAARRERLIERSKEFETMPLLRVACRGSFIEEMDIAGILQRHPKVCIVDDLAHTNAPGSERPAPLAGRAGSARRWRGRTHHDERAGSGEPQRSDLANHRLASARDGPGLGFSGGGRGSHGGRDAACVASPVGARRHLPSRTGQDWNPNAFFKSRRWSRCANSPSGRPRRPLKRERWPRSSLPKCTPRKSWSM